MFTNCQLLSAKVMPELPEVETVASFLRDNFLGQKIVRVQLTDGHLREPVAADYAEKITGGILTNVSRKGKYLFLHLKQSLAEEVLFHFGMSGRLLISQAFEPHERLRLEFEQASLIFVDPRRFGLTRVGFQLARFLPLGPDALTISFLELQQALKVKREVKEALMLQERICGIGNIYACEILFVAGIHPQTLASELSPTAVQQLSKAISQVLQEAIRHKGSSIADFYYGKVKQGGYQNHFKVYDREGQPCYLCGNPIVRIKQHGRSTWFCPYCQT